MQTHTPPDVMCLIRLCDPHYQTQIIENKNNLKRIDYVKDGAAQEFTFVILLYFKSSKTDFKKITRVNTNCNFLNDDFIY